MNAPARNFFDDLMEDLTLTRAIVDGAYELINSSRKTDGDESLCHARTLLGECLCRLEATYTRADVANSSPDKRFEA